MDERFVAHDPSFADVTGRSPRFELVVDCDAHEGPVYVAGEDALYVTSLPSAGPRTVVRRVALDGDRFPVDRGCVQVVPTEAVMANGMTLDHDGRLVVCEQGDRTHDACISRIDPATGDRTVVVDSWRGRRLNSPNDVVVAADGAIWFTDPTYGHLQGFRARPEVGAFVYRWDPVRRVADVVADGFDQPNGIALTVDGSTLYVTDSGADQAAGTFHADRPHHVVAFDVVAGRLAGRRLLAVTAPGIPDGIKTDDAGRVYVSSATGVLVYSPVGDLLGEILLPGAVNFTFGGRGRNVLFVTDDTAIWAAVLATSGGPVRPAARRHPSTLLTSGAPS
jgi:gluconolactonase